MKPHLALILALLCSLITACQPDDPAPDTMRPLALSPVPELGVHAAAPAPYRPTPTALPDDIISAADAEYRVLAHLYERVAPSVVYVDVTFAPDAQGNQPTASGSGFVIDGSGHIVTNAHLVRDSSSILVTFSDGYVTSAVRLGLDIFSDVAVLRVNANTPLLLPVTFGDSTALHVGERAVSIGNPFGLSSSMTVGIISGLGRQLPSAELMGSETGDFHNPSIIQIDAHIHAGSSGGPLLNSHAQVIGMTTAIPTTSGAFEGVGFAVPARTIQRVVPELIDHGSVAYPWLGIGSASVGTAFGVAGLAEPLRLPVQTGILIAGIAPGSPADAAGLRGGTREVVVRGRQVCTGGDILLAIDERAVHSMDDLLYHLMLDYRPGDTVVLRMIRGETTFDVPILLTMRPTTSADIPSCGG
ncbi:MAG: trypsin-like peptidase domain-containing protein [Chloroflexota bacterium]|nr:trypsin-like peptidase domain-containing protein [Chloroflexota bacterium]